MVDLAERVHRHGARLGAQLNFMGTSTPCSTWPRAGERWVPSKPRRPNPDRLWALMTDEETAASSAPFMVEGSEYRFHVMDEDDIAWMIDRYAEAAERCRRAGYDGVELHAGHGYLIDAFLSPRSTRDDRWGGSSRTGPASCSRCSAPSGPGSATDFPVWMRVNAVERVEDPGETFDDQCTVIRWAVAAGADAVHLTSYANPDAGTGATDSYAPHHAGPLSELAGRVRALVDVPVITYGRYEPDQAEQLLADGNADFVAMGRKLLADPDLPAQARATAGSTTSGPASTSTSASATSPCAPRRAAS